MRSFIETITCDRCGHKNETPPPTKENKSTIKRPGDDTERDLCKDCREQFWAWWRAAAQ